MKGLAVVLTFALLASAITPLSGLLETLVIHLGRCRCSKHTSAVISPKQLKTMHVIPRGINCRRTEVILTLKDNRKVCVRPDAPWVQTLIKVVTKRK